MLFTFLKRSFLPASLACYCLTTLAQSPELEIQRLREERDKTIWKDEREAQRHETAFIDLWDQLRQSGNSYQPLYDFAFNQIEKPQLVVDKDLPESIQRYRQANIEPKFQAKKSFDEYLRSFEQAGYVIEQTEWHHANFQQQPDEQAISEINFALHVRNESQNNTRFIIRGTLEIKWEYPETRYATPSPNRISFKNLKALSRSANETPFAETLWKQSRARSTPYSHVIVEDLNKDGLPDIIFPKDNSIHYNRGNFQFEESLLAKFPIKGQVTAAIIVDLDLDGKLEYVAAIHNAPYVFAYTYNSESETFDGKPFGIWKSDTPLIVQLIAAGDITGDGLPELYLGQSTTAYENGKMPTPYFDANDGQPAYLLRNVNGQRFVDITKSTDVFKKRGRRAYIASFQDLNEDGQLDLTVTSDFSGIDFYENTGDSLKDRTDTWVDDRSLFGMSQTFADFDRDGAIDLLAVGMSSTTARRLEKMGLGRGEFPEHQAMRMKIAHGNRLYYGNRKGVFKQQAQSENVSRSGWSWGSSALDFNNDSYPDIFVANGYLSKTTARDYCTNFWTHDIYQEETALAGSLKEFYAKLGPKSLVGGGKMSWNPFEKDHLYLNLSGEGFVNIAYLCGVSKGGDGRAVIGEDFDRDGKVDLLLVEQDSVNVLEKVYFFKNQFSNTKNWIGIDIKPTVGKPIIGTRIRIISANFETERVYTIGEAYAAQQASSTHFGLGETNQLIRVEAIWPDGTKTIIENPKLNQYHAIQGRKDLE